MGIDEAGRGPVIGPMVIAGVMVPEDKQETLREMGIKDSKLLSPKKREELYKEIEKVAEKIVVRVISAKEVDESLESETSNLNWLEADKTADILNEGEPDRAYVDCPSTNPEAYRDYLAKRLKKDIKLIVEHKADFKYSTSAAASIIAKVTRDREIAKLQADFEDSMGSGYPSDPATKVFLKKYWNKNPEIFRKSWESYKAVERGAGQKTLLDL